MYSYTEFKQVLKRIYGLSESDIFYIIGVMFDKTEGFTSSHKEKCYHFKENAVFYIEWSKETYGWNIEVDEW